MWHKIINIINNHTRFIITAHVNLDGDAIGSELALAEHLDNLGKDVTIINNDITPSNYHFLDPKTIINTYSPSEHDSIIHQAEVIISVDVSGGWERIGSPSEAFRQSKTIKVGIDHHTTPPTFADIVVTVTTVVAAAELIYDLLVTMNCTFSQTIAQAIYVGIMTDSGGFRFPPTNAHTHQTVAKLLAMGVDPYYVYHQIYNQHSLQRLLLKGHLITCIKTAMNGQIAYYTIDKQTMRNYGVTRSELGGFTNLGSEVKGVRVNIFLMETGENEVKIGLRSDGTIRVDKIANSYGGGGHPSAAGATVKGELNEVMSDVIEKVKHILKSQK